MYGFNRRRTHSIKGSTFQVTLRWPRDDRNNYVITTNSKSSVSTFHGKEQNHYGTVIYYSLADLDDHREVVQLSPDDFDDISAIDPESVPPSPAGTLPFTRGQQPSPENDFGKENANQEPLRDPDGSTKPERRTSSTQSATPSAVPPGLHDHESTSPGVTQIPQPTLVNSDSPMPGPATDMAQPSQFENTDFDATPAVPQQLPSPTTAHPPDPPDTPHPDLVDIENDHKRLPLESAGSQNKITKRTRFDDEIPDPTAVPVPVPVDSEDSQRTIEYDNNGEVVNPEVPNPIPSNSNSQPTTYDSQRTIEYDPDNANDEAATGDAVQLPLPTDNSQQTANTEDSQRTIIYDEEGEAVGPPEGEESTTTAPTNIGYVTESRTHVYCEQHREEYGNKKILSYLYNESHTLNAFVKETEDDDIASMTKELYSKLCSTLPSDKMDVFQDLVTGEILRVDSDTGLLTEAEMVKYAQLVYNADHKELNSFTDHKVFTARRREPGDNVVDCIWIRKWKIYGKEVKSRMCARGCFDKQKNLIERHNSTATRLSQRLLVSMAMCDGVIPQSSCGNRKPGHIHSLSPRAKLPRPGICGSTTWLRITH